MVYGLAIIPIVGMEPILHIRIMAVAVISARVLWIGVNIVVARNKDFEHGPFGYTNHACRCDICTEGNRLKNKENRENRYEMRRTHPDGYVYNPHANHGTTTGYQSYGCRCPACTKASTDARGNYKRNR